MIHPSATNCRAPVGGLWSEIASRSKGHADRPSQPALHARPCAQEGRTTSQDGVPVLITSSQERTMALLELRDGTELYYKDWGSGEPILFSHGWPLSADMWDAQMLFFAEHGYRTVAFDRRGFGRSSQPWTGYDYNTFADDMADLVNHLDLKDVTLVGFSMGGGDIARYVARHGTSRVSKFVLISAVTPLFVRTSDHDGVDKSVFDGIKAGLVKDRPQFLDDFNPLFYGTNHG